MDPIFGPFITGADVERAALDTLKRWTPTYLAWAERETGRVARALPEPRSWVTSTDLDRWPEEQLPSVLLLSTGLSGEPTKQGDGTTRAHFALGLAVIVSARDRDATDELAKVYTAVFRALMLQQASLGGFASGVEWIDERYDPLPDRSKRQLAAGQSVYRVEVPSVVASRGGLSEPLADPYAVSEPSVVEDAAAIVEPQEVS